MRSRWAIFSEQGGRFLFLPPWIALEVERMSQDEMDAGLGGTSISEVTSYPAEHALGADRQIVAIGRGSFEKYRQKSLFLMLVCTSTVAIQHADIHLAGVQINSAVELGGGGVVFHN